jgi:signal transduction histidine kinase
VGPSCQHRGVTLGVLAPGDTAETTISASRQPIEMYADAEQLRQLLLNLVLNAIEAAGAAGWVRCELEADDAHARVRVIDSGPGLSETLVDRLFEPFASDKPEGIGLGLSVAKTIAESHGGFIRYGASSPTTFEVTLSRQGVTPKVSTHELSDTARERPAIAAAAVNAVSRVTPP